MSTIEMLEEMQERKRNPEYRVRFPFLHMGDSNTEVIISSQYLDYSEIGKTAYGVQVVNQDNENEILEKCKQIADLFREIRILNNE